MNGKEFLKPSALKIFVFLFIGIFYLYFAGENVSAAGFGFAFYYNAYGFPFLYLVSGEIDKAIGYIMTLPLGDYFSKYGASLFNPVALALNIVLIYLLACFLSLLFKNRKDIDIFKKP